MGFTESMIAPCGVNCGICIGFLREKNKCCGCMDTGVNKPFHCSKCTIKYCLEHKDANFTYCYECSKFPCTRIKKLDKRYVENYSLSVIDNSKYLRQYSQKEFINSENEKWKCKHCGEVLSVHRNSCLSCKTEYR